MNNYLVIEGVTESGVRFRPSDWVERMASMGANFGPDRRLTFSSSLRPIRAESGRALAVSLHLQQDAPLLWRQVLDFAHSNGLRINGLVTSEALEPMAMAS